MADDPLAKFRRKGAQESPARPDPSAATGPKDALKPYKAHEGKDRALSLDIHRVLGPTHSPAYRYLYNVSYDNEYFTNFVLEFGFMTVKVRGKNLQDIVASIKRHTCEFIQDFDAREHERPADNEPLIESIVVERLDKRVAGSEAEAAGEPPAA